MRSFALGLAVAAIALAAPTAEAAVTPGSGAVMVSATAWVACTEGGGEVESPSSGDDTVPYTASVTAGASAPCADGDHTAHGEASAGGDVSSDAAATTITAQGSADASGQRPHQANGSASFTQTFTVDSPTHYELVASGSVTFDGGPAGSGTLQPGTYTVSAEATCEANAADEDGCGGSSFSLTLELTPPAAGGNPGGDPGAGGQDPGGSPNPGGGGQADVPPALSGLAVRPRRFRAATAAAISFDATAAGFVRFTVERRVPGRRVGGKCVNPTRGNRGARRCMRFVRLRGSFTSAVAAGHNTIAFRARLRGRRLAAGSYRLVATPLSSTSRTPGAAKRAAFRIQQPSVTSR